MPRRTIRLSADIDERLQSNSEGERLRQPSAFLRAAIDHEIERTEEHGLGLRNDSPQHGTNEAEIFRLLAEAQQALFAFREQPRKVC